MKLKREAHALYLKPKGSQDWYLVGKGIDDLSVEMNGSFEQIKDITGNVTVSDTGYQPQISVEPYHADPEESIYPFLKDLAMNRKSGDDAIAEMLEVIVEDTEAVKHSAWKENVKIEITSYGGDTSGLGINFNIWSDGDRKEGTATLTDKKPTFTEGASL